MSGAGARQRNPRALPRAGVGPGDSSEPRDAPIELPQGDAVTGALVSLRDGLDAHLDHALALILLLARLADVLSTRFASPRLALEANPLVRRLGWPFAWSTLGVCLVAYVPGFGPPIALAAIVVSLFVAASNLSRGWAMRALGEEAYRAHMQRVLSASKPASVYLAIAASSSLLGAAGALLLVLYPEPTEAAHFFAIGILLYALATWLHSSVAIRRMLREAARASGARD